MACTSWAAASMFLLRLNWSVICAIPCPDTDVMLSRPAIVENWRSSGVATAEAMVSGLAPGSAAFTRTVGKSTFGRSLTGSIRYAMIPNRRMADMTSVVMTGLFMKGSAIFISFKQALNNKLQTLIHSKNQYRNARPLGNWDLVFGSYLEFVTSDLGFPFCCCSPFTST